MRNSSDPPGGGSACAVNCLYVNAATGDDSRTKTQARNPATPWATIGRAAWGSANRSSPNTSQAAAAGDTVEVAGGTYDTTVTLNIDEHEVFYRPVNTGTTNNYITFACVGVCRLTGNTLAAPIIGAGDNFGIPNNYIKWIANRTLGHSWQIDSCGNGGICPVGSVKIRQDSGPVVCIGQTGVWIEGLIITSSTDAPSDNYNGIRLIGCTSARVTRNTVSGFHVTPSTNNHGGCFQSYGSQNVVIEHNYCFDSGAGVGLKDNGSIPSGNTNISVRYNYFKDVAQPFYVSHQETTVADGRSHFYQNVINGCHIGVNIQQSTGGDWFFNNSFYNCTLGAGIGFLPGGALTAGVRFWNNILHTANFGIYVECCGMPAEPAADNEHNVYFAIGTFFLDEQSGSQTFATYRSNNPTQDQANSPSGTVSVVGNPLFANISSEDFRICTGPGVPHASCTGASPAVNRGVDLFDLDGDGSTTDAINAGAYVSNSEVIGLNP